MKKIKLFQGDVVLVNLDPTQGSEQKGIRPAVVYSAETMNQYSTMCIILPVTSKIKYYAGSVTVDPNNQNGLKKVSEVMTAQIRSVSQDRVKKKLGNVGEEVFEKIKEAFDEITKY